nr:MAG TPA: hypothetical protein [Caudoviricetes sp.]
MPREARKICSLNTEAPDLMAGGFSYIFVASKNRTPRED